MERSRNTMPATTRIVGMGVSFSAVRILSMGLSVVALAQVSPNLTAFRRTGTVGRDSEEYRLNSREF
jgi:hypothetical protein